MKEIKFRAYHKTMKIVLDVLVIDWINELVDLEGGLIEQEFKDVELLQYTGLKDKNGVDIYEGDVLTLKYPRDRRYTVTAKVIRGTQISAMVLKFEDGFTTEEIPLYKISAEHNLEVIGNIYENPELLEVEL